MACAAAGSRRFAVVRCRGAKGAAPDLHSLKGKVMEKVILGKLVGKFDEALVMLYINNGYYYVAEKGHSLYQTTDKEMARRYFRERVLHFL